MDNTPEEPRYTWSQVELTLGLACITAPIQCAYWFGNMLDEGDSGHTWQLYVPLLITVALCTWAFAANRALKRQRQLSKWVRRDGKRLP